MEIDFFAREKGELFRHFRETHWQRWYEPDEIKEAARNAGFTQVRCFSAFTHQPCLPEDERIFLSSRGRSKPEHPFFLCIYCNDGGSQGAGENIRVKRAGSH